MKVHLTALGCPKNEVDSELMLGALTEAGFPLADRPEDAECLIVNTCAFIDRAREEPVATILELARLKERGRCRSLIVTGCLTQRYGGEILREMPEVDGILGTSNLSRIVDLVRQAANRHDWATSAPPGYLYDATTPRLLAAKVPYAYVKIRSEEHTSELQSRLHLVCRLLLEKKKSTSRFWYISIQRQI